MLKQMSIIATVFNLPKVCAILDNHSLSHMDRCAALLPESVGVCGAEKISIINEHRGSERLKVSRVSFIDSEC